MTEFTPSPDWKHSSDYRTETLTNGRFRVRIVRDDYPSEPEFDAGCPILRIDGSHVEDVGYGSGYPDGFANYEASEVYSHFVREFGIREAVGVFARYLKIYHDGNLVEFDNNHSRTDYTYVSYVTRTLWESWGNTGEVGKAEMGEWQSYLEGDVWGVITEKLTKWVKLDENVPGWSLGKPTSETRETWEEIEEGSIWGYYGEDSAKQEAEMNLNMVVDADRGYRLTWSYRKGLPPVVTLFFTPRLATEPTPIAQFDTMEAGRAALEAHYAKEGL